MTVSQRTDPAVAVKPRHPLPDPLNARRPGLELGRHATGRGSKVTRSGFLLGLARPRHHGQQAFEREKTVKIGHRCNSEPETVVAPS
jgi:hypothetical protein